MTASQYSPIRLTRIATASKSKLALLALLGTLAGLLSGCGETSVFNAAAPLASNVTIPYSISVGNADEDGLASFNGRDGSDAWHAAVGESSIVFTPVMANGIIYTEGGSRPPGQSTLLAVRASDGHILWKFLAPIWDFGMATDGVIVLVEAGAHGLYALDAKTGALRWQRAETAVPRLYVKDGVAIATITDTQGASAHFAFYEEEDGKPLWQLPETLSVDINHTAIYTSDTEEVLAYASQTGKVLWHSETAGKIIAVNEQAVLISDGQNVTSLDVATGHTLWDAPVALEGWSSVAQTPTLIYGASQNGADQDEVIALRLSDGSELWHSEFPGHSVVQVIEVQGVVFALLTSKAENHQPPRVVALDGAVGKVYWSRDSQEISILVNNVQM